MKFPACRYKSEPIDAWCMECYRMRHAPFQRKHKRIDGQYNKSLYKD